MKLKIISLSTSLAWLIGCSIPAVAQTASGLSPFAVTAPNFSYAGDKGPGFWDKIDAACGGQEQSPINIDTRSVNEDTTLKALDLSLAETSFTLTNPEPGYTIQATPPKDNPNMLVHDGTTFTLLQFHFHTLSEHTLDGRHSDMELHAVFRDKDNHYAVIGVLYRIGKESLMLQKLIDAGLPEHTTSLATEIQSLKLVLQDTGSYYTYHGSFTTPPCPEIVTWFVLKREAELSPRQFEALRRILGNDFRPTQNLNERTVSATVPQ